MNEHLQIRALYDNDTITVYQAYNHEIASIAAKHNKFLAPFSFNRMTWIKPSFLWMMYRSGWGNKPNQENILSIKLKRDCFDNALKQAVLTSPDKQVYKDSDEWKNAMSHAKIIVQWDPERDINGNKLDYRAIQIGISKFLINEFNENWIVTIENISDLVSEIYKLKCNGDINKAKTLLPKETIYRLEIFYR